MAKKKELETIKVMIGGKVCEMKVLQTSVNHFDCLDTDGNHVVIPKTALVKDEPKGNKNKTDK